MDSSHSTMPTGNIPEAPELGTKCWFPMVSAIERFNCKQMAEVVSNQGRVTASTYANTGITMLAHFYAVQWLVVNLATEVRQR